MSKINTSAMLIHNAGQNLAAGNNPEQSGFSIGGTYYPAHTIGGRHLSARWDSTFFHNIPATENSAAKKIALRITAWNSRNAKVGGGLADICAKYLSAGKGICASLGINQYQARVYIDNKVALNAAGQPHLESKIGYRMLGMPDFVNDGAKQVALEIQNWNANPGIIGFNSRPPGWNTAGSKDHLEWTTVIVPARKATCFDGNPTYGYARVIVPTGAILDVPMIAGGGTVGGNAAGIRSTEGFTIEQYRAATPPWSDEAMLADSSGKFMPFIAAGLIGRALGGPSGPTGGPSGPGGYSTAAGAGDEEGAF